MSVDKVLRVQDSLATYSEALATAAVAAAAENQRGHSIYIPPKDQPPRPGEESFCCCAMTTEDHRNVGKTARRLLLRSSRPAALPGEELRTEKMSAGPRARGQKRTDWADRPLSSVPAQRRQRVAAVGGRPPAWQSYGHVSGCGSKKRQSDGCVRHRLGAARGRRVKQRRLWLSLLNCLWSAPFSVRLGA